jgi:hypothetical protein
MNGGSRDTKFDSPYPRATANIKSFLYVLDRCPRVLLVEGKPDEMALKVWWQSGEMMLYSVCVVIFQNVPKRSSSCLSFTQFSLA